MAIFSIFDFNINIAPFKFGNIDQSLFKGVAYLGAGSNKLHGTPPQELVIPWQKKLPPGADVFTLLNWRAGISDFKGRTDEESTLIEWANSDHDVLLKFICGDGGVGKSRLAAEFATELSDQHEWAAGFVDLRKAQSFCLPNNGTLLVVDYPEENRQGVREFLQDLGGNAGNARLRILFLTRQPLEAWIPLIHDCHTEHLLDQQPIHLREIAPTPAHELYNTALETAAEHFNTIPPPLSQEALTSWLQQAAEHARP
ncbi:hypothetical protein ACFLQW_00010 [Candidatus Zixiibacteriota bacterium]